MRGKVLKYHDSHGRFCPTFSIIFTGSKAVVSIKHRGTDRNVGHQETYYGLFFWIRLALSIRKCFKQQINHNKN